MKKIIRIEKESKNTHKVIDWALHDVCNYRCSFCSPEFWAGENRWFDIEVYKSIIKKISEQSDKPVWFKITGGEPTLYPKLDEVLGFIKELGHYTFIISNGSRTLRWWKKMADQELLDVVNLSYHPEQTEDYEHICEVVKCFEKQSTHVHINVTCPLAYFDKAVQAHNYFLDNLIVVSHLQQINDQEGMLKYNKYQLEILKNNIRVRSPNYSSKPKWHVPMDKTYHNGNLNVYFDDGSKEVLSSSLVIKNSWDNFQGWNCSAGIDLIRIESDKIYRATCKEGEEWSVHDKKIFREDSVICTKTSCRCDLDIMQTKIKGP